MAATTGPMTSYQKLLADATRIHNSRVTRDDSVHRCDFLDLPGEVRDRICSYLLPAHSTIGSMDQTTFWANSNGTNNENWSLVSLSYEELGTTGIRVSEAGFASELFLLNKQISLEAQGLFYASNTFARFLSPIGLARNNSVHAAQNSDQLGLFCNMRSLLLYHLIVPRANGPIQDIRTDIDKLLSGYASHMQNGMHTERLENLRLFAGLDVELLPRRYRKDVYVQQHKYIGDLEGLADLQCSGNIRIERFPYWFEQCLTLCIRGQRNTLRPARYPRKPNKKRFGPATTKVQKWWYPKYNWKEFAERNNVIIPPHLEWLKVIR